MNGLIGFFDILGYKNFLNNNSEVEQAKKTLEIVNNLPHTVKSDFKRVADRLSNSSSSKKINAVVTQLNPIIFSDTIVFFLPLETSEYQISDALKAMVLVSAYFTKEMFINGLPIRGALHKGDYLTDKNCFAGRGIIEAYNLCEALDFSGVACTKEFYDEIKKANKRKIIERLTFEYLAPLKSMEDRLLILNWLSFLSEDEFNKCKNDVELFILKSFWDHNKDCSNSVDLKIQNLAKSIRKMILDRKAKELEDLLDKPLSSLSDNIKSDS
jgi:hypothetical protein